MPRGKKNPKFFCHACYREWKSIAAVVDVPLNNTEIRVKNIPVYLCDCCKSIVGYQEGALELIKQQLDIFTLLGLDLDVGVNEKNMIVCSAYDLKQMKRQLDDVTDRLEILRDNLSRI